MGSPGRVDVSARIPPAPRPVKGAYPGGMRPTEHRVRIVVLPGSV